MFSGSMDHVSISSGGQTSVHSGAADSQGLQSEAESQSLGRASVLSDRSQTIQQVRLWIKAHCLRYGCECVDSGGEFIIVRASDDVEAGAAMGASFPALLAEIYLAALRQEGGFNHKQCIRELEHYLVNTLNKIEHQDPTDRSYYQLFLRCFSGENLAITPFLKWLATSCKNACIEPIPIEERDINYPTYPVLSRKKRWGSYGRPKPTQPPPPPSAIYCNRASSITAVPGGKSTHHFGLDAVPSDLACSWMVPQMPQGLAVAEKDILCADKYEDFVVNPSRNPPPGFVTYFKAGYCPRIINDPLKEDILDKAARCEARQNLGGVVGNWFNKASDKIKGKFKGNNIPCNGYNSAAVRRDKILYCEGSNSGQWDKDEWKHFLRKSEANALKKYNATEVPVYCPAPPVGEPICNKLKTLYPAEFHADGVKYYQAAFGQASCAEVLKKHHDYKEHRVRTTTPAPTTVTAQTSVAPTTNTSPLTTLFPDTDLVMPAFCQPNITEGEYSWKLVPSELTCQLLGAECSYQNSVCDVSCADLFSQAQNSSFPPSEIFTDNFKQIYCQGFNTSRWDKIKEAQSLCGRYKQDFEDIKREGLAGVKQVRDGGRVMTTVVGWIPQSMKDTFKQCAVDGATVCGEVGELYYDALDDAAFCINGTISDKITQKQQQAWMQITNSTAKKYSDDHPPKYCQQQWHNADISCNQTLVQNKTDIRYYQQAYEQAKCAEINLQLKPCNKTIPLPVATTTETPPIKPTSAATQASTVDDITRSVPITTPEFKPTTPAEPVLPTDHTNQLVGAVSFALTGGLSFYPTVMKEWQDFRHNRHSVSRMASSALRLTSVTGMLASPALLMANMGIASSVAAAAGTAAMVAQLPFTLKDTYDFLWKQDRSFKDKIGAATQYCRRNMECDTAGTLASDGVRIGVQCTWLAQHIMEIFGTGFASPVKLALYIPTLANLLSKGNLKAFQSVSFDNMFSEQMRRQMLPLIAMSRLVEDVQEEEVAGLVNLLEDGASFKYQLGGQKLIDKQEMLFLTEFFKSTGVDKGLLASIKTILLKIYTYQLPQAEVLIGKMANQDVQQVLTLILTSRQKDKGYRRNQRGCVSANAVYESCIATIIKLMALKENRTAQESEAEEIAHEDVDEFSDADGVLMEEIEMREILSRKDSAPSVTSEFAKYYQSSSDSESDDEFDISQFRFVPPIRANGQAFEMQQLGSSHAYLSEAEETV